MKASKFSEARIAFVLKQAEDGTAIAEVCRKAGIAEATFYNWRKRYAGLMRGEALAPQADLKLRIKQICENRVRYGYRWVHVLKLGRPVNDLCIRSVNRPYFTIWLCFLTP